MEARQRVLLVHDHGELGEVSSEPAVDERLLADERADAVREALARLPWRHQRLLNLLMADPPASYAEISDQLGLPVGSIGPTRGRCLERLRLLLEAS
jgi:DNA-directed RNA polymerase specialized sigma24 family protein